MNGQRKWNEIIIIKNHNRPTRRPNDQIYIIEPVECAVTHNNNKDIKKIVTQWKKWGRQRGKWNKEIEKER